MLFNSPNVSTLSWYLGFFNPNYNPNTNPSISIDLSLCISYLHRQSSPFTPDLTIATTQKHPKTPPKQQTQVVRGMWFLLHAI